MPLSNDINFQPWYCHHFWALGLNWRVDQQEKIKKRVLGMAWGRNHDLSEKIDAHDDVSSERKWQERIVRTFKHEKGGWKEDRNKPFSMSAEGRRVSLALNCRKGDLARRWGKCFQLLGQWTPGRLWASIAEVCYKLVRQITAMNGLEIIGPN